MARPKGSHDTTSRSFWTLSEEQEFKIKYHVMSNSELCQYFNKSKTAISSLAKELGLLKFHHIYPQHTLEIIQDINIKGVYGICRKHNSSYDKIYIGHSNTNIGERIKTHIRNLNNNSHINTALQKDWNNGYKFYYIIIFTSTNNKEIAEYEEKCIVGLNGSGYNHSSQNEQVRLTEKQKQRFWNKIDKQDISKCWIWTGRTDEDGYGRVSYYNKTYRSHRIVYYLHYDIWPNGLMVRHQCDNPSCCNPHHLSLGTCYDNVQDTIKRKRHHSSRFTRDDVAKIAQLLEEGKTQQEIATILNTNHSLISSIVRGQIKSLQQYSIEFNLKQYTGPAQHNKVYKAKAINVYRLSPEDIENICQLSLIIPMPEIDKLYNLQNGYSKNILSGKLKYYREYLPTNYDYSQRYRKGHILNSVSPKFLNTLYQSRIDGITPLKISSKLKCSTKFLYKIISLTKFKEGLYTYFRTNYTNKALGSIIIQILINDLQKAQPYIVYDIPYHVKTIIEYNIQKKSSDIQEILTMCQQFIQSYDIFNIFPLSNFIYIINHRQSLGAGQTYQFTDEQNRFVDELGVFLDSL